MILLVIVRVGALGAGYIERWLDDEAIGEQNRDYNEGSIGIAHGEGRTDETGDTGRTDQDSFTDDITGFTDWKEPVRTRKGL